MKISYKELPLQGKVYYVLASFASSMRVFTRSEWRAMHTPRRWSSPLMESFTEVVAGVPQIVYKVPLDGSLSPLIADLDFAQVFDRLIVGPTPYPWPIYGAFVEALKATGVPNADERVFVSNIPNRAIGLGYGFLPFIKNCFRNAKSLEFRLCSFNQLQRPAERGFWNMRYWLAVTCP